MTVDITAPGPMVVATVYFTKHCPDGSFGDGSTPWTAWSYEFDGTEPTGPYTVRARILNIGDGVVDSTSGVDGVELIPAAEPDADLDGVPDATDNCIDIFNTNQDNPDGDMWGTLCDNCPKVANDDQSDADGDNVGDACDVDDINPAEDLDKLSPEIVRPGEPLQVSATFKNPSDSAILTVQPDCFNTVFEVRRISDDELLDPRHLIRTPVNLALKKDGGDLIKLEANESFTITCNLADQFAPEVLTSGSLIEYSVTAHYANNSVNPNCLPARIGSNFVPDLEQCPELTEETSTFLGVVSSESVTVKLEGDLILPEVTVNGSCTIVPSTWFPEDVGILNTEVTATITGVPVIEVDPAAANILFEGVVSPKSTLKTDSEVVVVFDRSAAVSALASLKPGDTRYPEVTGLLDGPTGEAFKATCVVEIGSAIAVEIDIKPGSEENTINLGSKGNVPVAIFSTPEFDAATINPATITLANATLKMKGKGTLMYSLTDLNEDDLLDMVIHVETQGFELTTSESADLSGRTFSGTPIFGTDSIRVVKE